MTNLQFVIPHIAQRQSTTISDLVRVEVHELRESLDPFEVFHIDSCVSTKEDVSLDHCSQLLVDPEPCAIWSLSYG